jgi:PPOX class probable F420-dependent enzyme
MPKIPIPAKFTDLLEGNSVAHFATISLTGRPNVNPVWFLWDGEHILLSVRGNSRKYRNLQRDPRVALSIVDPVRPMRYLELRGVVIDFKLFLDLTFVNKLAQKYTGADFSRGYAGEERYKVTMFPETWTGLDG